MSTHTAPRPQRIIDVPLAELAVGHVIDGLGPVTQIFRRVGATTVYVDGAVRHYLHEQFSTAPVWVDAIAGGRSALDTPTGQRVQAATGITPAATVGGQIVRLGGALVLVERLADGLVVEGRPWREASQTWGPTRTYATHKPATDLTAHHAAKLGAPQVG